METKKKFGIIGIGNCGSQVATLAEKKYPTLFDCIYINTSESDLAMAGTDSSLKFKIGEKDNIEGAGKNRSSMKRYLKNDITSLLANKNIQDTIVSKKYCFVVSSTAGGTGSGAAPVLMEILSQVFPNVHLILVLVLPQINSSRMELGNSLEYLDELYSNLGNIPYMVYDNETTVDLPPTKALETVNENIVEDIRVFTGVDNYPTQYDSIDESDMERIITRPGRIIVSRLNKGITEKAMEDNILDDIIIKNIKSSCHAETNRDQIVGEMGIITYFTNEVYNLYSPKHEKLKEFLGNVSGVMPRHVAVNNGDESLNFIYIIASGLSPINDRAKKIQNRIEELNNSISTNSGYALDKSSYDFMKETEATTPKKSSESINADAIFEKFM